MNQNELVAMRLRHLQRPVEDKAAIRAELERQQAEFLARGGAVEQAQSPQLRATIRGNTSRRVWVEEPVSMAPIRQPRKHGGKR